MAAAMGGAPPGGMSPPGAGGPPGGAPPAVGGPQAAPMSQPTQNAGAIQQAAAMIESAMQVLSRAMAQLEVATPEWEAVNKALGVLAKPFAKQQAQDLVPAQILQMAQAQQASPLMQILSQQQPQGGAGAPPQGA